MEKLETLLYRSTAIEELRWSTAMETLHWKSYDGNTSIEILILWKHCDGNIAIENFNGNTHVEELWWRYCDGSAALTGSSYPDKPPMSLVRHAITRELRSRARVKPCPLQVNVQM